MISSATLGLSYYRRGIHCVDLHTKPDGSTLTVKALRHKDLMEHKDLTHAAYDSVAVVGFFSPPHAAFRGKWLLQSILKDIFPFWPRQARLPLV